MKLDALSKRLEILEARIKPIDRTAEFLAKRSDEELNLLIEVLTVQEEGRELELKPEQERITCSRFGYDAERRIFFGRSRLRDEAG